IAHPTYTSVQRQKTRLVGSNTRIDINRCPRSGIGIVHPCLVILIVLRLAESVAHRKSPKIKTTAEYRVSPAPACMLKRRHAKTQTGPSGPVYSMRKMHSKRDVAHA